MPLFRPFLPALIPLLGLVPLARAAEAQPGDPAKGKTYYRQSCILCHADALGADGKPVIKQGPSLVDVVGRRAGTEAGFSYTDALAKSGLTWDAATLDRFLANPPAAVPGTTMPIPVPDPGTRHDLIAYLVTLKGAAAPTPPPVPAAAAKEDLNDWHHDAPGTVRRITAADLPAPYATVSAGNGPKVVKPPQGATVSVPPGFTAKVFASGLTNPRVLRIAPNGDIFLAETAAKRVRVLRAVAGAEAPSANEIFAADLDRPFGIAFWPPGPDPKWVYVANNNAVVRFAYHNGDLHAQGAPEVIVPKLCDSGGGHSTRDIAFSLDGKRLFISVGSASNVAEGMTKKSPDEIKAWEAEHGRGAAWDGETNRALILVCDPEGHGLHTFATGIRNGVGIAVHPETGDLWTSTNERDGLGDDLVPDYVSRIKEGGYYGWPWYYIGNHEEPRLVGARPDLAKEVLVPDVLLQAHSASLEMCFYDAKSGPALFPPEYRGDAFAALHGSWNRTSRTGYKIVRIRLNHGVPTGEYDDFLTGFVADAASVWGRPVGVATAHDGALLVTEDGNGTLWRVAYAKKD